MEKGTRLQRHPIWRTIRTILIGILVVILAVGIMVWTRSLREKDRLERQREVLADVLDRDGELGLLELAGVTVNDIFYGDQGVSVFLGNMGAYSYSADEMRNIAIYEKSNKSVAHITTLTLGLNTFLEVLPVQGYRFGYRDQ